MGIFDTLTTAVSGLQAQAFALQNISGNIANSQTTGYKETGTSFEDLVSASSSLADQAAGNVLANSFATNNVQGSIQTTSVSTDMAINGDGFFVVAQPTSVSDNNPVFTGADLYTRRGDFQQDQNGYLVNGAGDYLMGVPLDPTTGNPIGSVPQVLQFGNNVSPAVATTQIDYAANLPSLPQTADYSSTTPQSELLDPTKFSTNPLIAGSGTVVGSDVSTFLNQSVSGGSVTAYDSLGNPVNVQMRWAKVDSASQGGTHADTWQLFYQADSNPTATSVAWQNVGTAFTFGSNGQLNPAIPNLSLTKFTVNGDSLGTVNINFASGGLTQFANPSGAVTVNQIQQNGSPSGSLKSVSVNNQGRLVGSYSNGQTIALAQVSLATFKGENYLQSEDGGAFAATPQSGSALFSASGSIVGSSLESSNVDIATQFSQLIVAQQAYSANAKVMTTANQMIQSLLTSIQ